MALVLAAPVTSYGQPGCIQVYHNSNHLRITDPGNDCACPPAVAPPFILHLLHSQQPTLRLTSNPIPNNDCNGSIHGTINLKRPGGAAYSVLETNDDFSMTSQSGDLILSSRAAGAKIQFGTTPTGGSSDFERMRIAQNGFVGVRSVNMAGTFIDPVEQFQIGNLMTFHDGGSKFFGFNVDVDQTTGLAYNIQGNRASAQIVLGDGGVDPDRFYINIDKNASTGGQVFGPAWFSNYTGLTLEVGGQFGIGENDPVCRLHVDGGAMLVEGTTGTTPVSGAGTRMMWIPAKGAFRAGTVSGTEWDDVNIATYSAAFGYENQVGSSLGGAFASAAFGSSNVVLGDRTLVTGDGNTVNYGATASLVYGTQNDIASALPNDANCLVGGLQSIVNGTECVALGKFAEVSGEASVALGYDVSAINPTAGDHTAVAIGHDVTVSGSDVVGIGAYIDVNADFATVIGAGVGGSPLTSTQNQSLMVGYNSDIPTLTVTGSSGVGTTGSVIVGDNAVTLTQNFDPGWTPASGTSGGATTPLDVKLYVNGNTYVDGEFWCTSDATKKKNIQDYQGGLDILRQIQPKSYQFKDVSLGTDTHVGILAQELVHVLPEAVKPVALQRVRVVEPAHWSDEGVETRTWIPAVVDTTYETSYSVNSQPVLYTMVNAVRELDARQQQHTATIAEMQRTIDELRAEVAALRTQGGSAGAASTSLQDKVFLDQNNPNPFSGTTEIRYWIDASVAGPARLAVYSVHDNTMVASRALQAGEPGTVTLDASSWPKGAYLYALEVAGRPVVSKKMLIMH